MDVRRLASEASLAAESVRSVRTQTTEGGRKSLATATGTVVTASAHHLAVDYNDSAPQFTMKAVIAGLVSGTVCTFLALYYSLKTGITPSLNILGSVIGFSVAKVLLRVPGFAGGTFTPQENAVIQTFSVAVYSVANPSMGFASGWLGLSKEAYEVANLTADKPDDVVDINFGRSAAWAFSLSLFGFFIAYPLRNHYIIRKKLLFPSGTATSYIINTLHASKRQAKVGLALITKYMSVAFVVNMVTWYMDGLANFPIFGMKAANWGFALDFDLGSFGIGMLLSLPVNFSMLFGAIICDGIMKPMLEAYRDGADPNVTPAEEWYNSETQESVYLGLYAYGMFFGLALMLAQGAWAVGEISWLVYTANRDEKKARRAIEDAPVNTNGQNGQNGLEGLDELGSREGTMVEAEDPEEAKMNEIFLARGFPKWASCLAYVGTSAITVLVHHFMLDTEWYQTLIALVIMPMLAMANMEGMGRTDWDVSSAYGKLMMFPIGAWNHGRSIIPSVAICHTTISGCSNAATLMQDFKTGYLLGADPEMMFLAQVVGILFGCLITPGLFAMMRSAWNLPVNVALHPDAFVTGLFGPIYRTLAVVATQGGFNTLPGGCLWISFGGLVAAFVLSIATSLADVYAPAVSPFIPSVSAMSIGALVGATVPLEFTIGGIIMWWWSRFYPVRVAAEKNYAASGLIAGSGFAVILQVIASLCNFNPQITVGFNDVSEPMGGGSTAMGVIVLLVLLSVMALGGYVWFKIPEGDLTDLDQDDDEDDEQDAKNGRDIIHAQFGNAETEVESRVSTSENSLRLAATGNSPTAQTGADAKDASSKDAELPV